MGLPMMCPEDTKGLYPVGATFVSIRDLLRPRWLIDNESNERMLLRA